MGTKNKARLLSDRLEPRYLPTGAWGHTMRRLRDREDDLLDLIDDTDANVPRHSWTTSENTTGT